MKNIKPYTKQKYEITKIQNFNKIDQKNSNAGFNVQDDLKNFILNIKQDTTKINLKTELHNCEETRKKDLIHSINNRTNKPYKGITFYDCDKKIENKEDLIIQKVSTIEKRREVLDKDIEYYQQNIQQQNKEFNIKYSKQDEFKHKIEFDKKNKYTFRTKTDKNDDKELRIDRIECYKHAQQKIENEKKRIDDILLFLIEEGVVSENLDKIDYSKINNQKIETLKNSINF